MLYESFGIDITELTGIETTNGLELYTEVGSDMSAWATDQHFASWLGLSPNAQSSGGKMKSSQTRKVASRAAQVFRMAAKSASRSKTYIGAFYRRMKARLGAPKAMTATAHKIAVIFYHMVKERKPYQDLGEDYYLTQQKQRQLKRLKKQAKLFGFDLVPNTEAGSDA